jgi:hypothetical protein
VEKYDMISMSIKFLIYHTKLINNGTSGKLHKIPHVRNNLDPICGRVAEIGDLTKPLENMRFIRTMIKIERASKVDKRCFINLQTVVPMEKNNTCINIL